jgi:hypothetical protein
MVDLDDVRRRDVRPVRGRRRRDRRHEPHGRARQGAATAAAKYMVTALVLLAAVTIDALSHRGRIAGT